MGCDSIHEQALAPGKAKPWLKRSGSNGKSFSEDLPGTGPAYPLGFSFTFVMPQHSFYCLPEIARVISANMSSEYSNSGQHPEWRTWPGQYAKHTHSNGRGASRSDSGVFWFLQF